TPSPAVPGSFRSHSSQAPFPDVMNAGDQRWLLTRVRPRSIGDGPGVSRPVDPSVEGGLADMGADDPLPEVRPRMSRCSRCRSSDVRVSSRGAVVLEVPSDALRRNGACSLL